MYLSTTSNKRNRQALLKAKYRPQVDAGSIMHREKPCDLDLWPMTLKFKKVLEVAEVHVVENFTQLRAVVHELSR